jgi:pre-mRNA-splicing helicase BRR2
MLKIFVNLMDKEKRKELYSYAANANLVLQADRSLIGKRSNEPTGEAESLVGKLHKFGDRVAHSKPDQNQKKKEYQPKTNKSQDTFQLILVFLAKVLGDVPQDVLISCADACLHILKSDIKDLDKLKEIRDLVQSDISSEDFAQLLNLSKKIVDFQDEPAIEETEVAVVFDSEEESEPDYVTAFNVGK